MRKGKKLYVISALFAVIGFVYLSCGGGYTTPLAYDPDAADGNTNIGKTGPGGGIIFNVRAVRYF